jgi:hypothetical protein
MTDSQVLMASRTVDPRRLEFDEEDFIAFAAPFLRHGWRLAAGHNSYNHYLRVGEKPYYSHAVLLFRMNYGVVQYRILDDDQNGANSIPKKITIQTRDERDKYYNGYSCGYLFAHFATVFPGVKPVKGEQQLYGIEPDGKGEKWPEDDVSEETITKVIAGGRKYAESNFEA